jgi:hypothetical protein
MNNYDREQLTKERAKNDETRGDFAYLTGYYGDKAERSGNAELAALVREMNEVLDGTWQRPEVLR